jgi:hypothetical protein
MDTSKDQQELENLYHAGRPPWLATRGLAVGA